MCTNLRKSALKLILPSADVGWCLSYEIAGLKVICKTCEQITIIQFNVGVATRAKIALLIVIANKNFRSMKIRWNRNFVQDIHIRNQYNIK